MNKQMNELSKQTVLDNQLTKSDRTARNIRITEVTAIVIPTTLRLPYNERLLYL